MTSRKAEFWRKVQEAKLLVQQATAEADLRRDEFLNREQKSPDAVYQPTQTSDMNRPRTVAARYWKDEQVIQVSWRDGRADYNYYECTPADWRRFTSVKSPGKLINRYFNGKPYGPAE
jgi:hypothetical protein